MKKIFVTKPLLSPLHELIPYLEQIWEAGILTNGGAVHSQFEQALCSHLGIKYVSLVSNGTLALMLALKALNLTGEVITTPFTHISTSQAIYWNNLKPVYVDINETDFNINVSAIEQAINENTTAILPVHVFGSPCDIEGINKLAQKYHLKVIYDAAHCFATRLNGQSVGEQGDLSILSFHATKAFNSIEGGAIISHDKKMKDYIDALKNNGINTNFQSVGYGFNAKMNEIQAAYGLVQLNHVDKAIELRKSISNKYRELLNDIDGLAMLNEQVGVEYNYSYFPIVINPAVFGKSRDEIASFLEINSIYTKKYFYPLIPDFKAFTHYKKYDLSIANKIANNILCLPLSHDTKESEVELIVSLLKNMHQS